MLNMLIAAFAIILLLIVLVAVIGAVGRSVAKRKGDADPVIADTRDEFDVK